MGWKPIDVAPRDGTGIAAAFRSSLTGEVSVAMVRWKHGAWERCADADVAATITDVAFAWVEAPTDIGQGEELPGAG